MTFGLQSFYERRILPRMVNCACGVEACAEQRAQIVPRAEGRVLDVGFGSGLNLPFYDSERVEKLWAAEPSAEMWALAHEHLAKISFPVEHLLVPAEELPLADQTIDTVVITYTLCTIADLPRAMQQIKRVLVPGGRVLFCEHGLDANERVSRWQHRLDPIWSRLFGGCHLNRRIPELLERGGFRIVDLWAGNILDLKLVSFNYRGQAVPA